MPVILFFLPAGLLMGMKNATAAALTFGCFLSAGAVAAFSYLRQLVPERARRATTDPPPSA